MPAWMKYMGFVVGYFAVFSAFLSHHPGRGTKHEAIIDLRYQLVGYFSEPLYGRLRADPQDENYLGSLSPGTKIG